MGRSSSTPSTQTTTSEPPAYLRPYLQEGVQQAQSLYQSGGTPVTPFSPQTQDALNMTEARARAGSPLNQAANQYATNVIRGGYYGNPAVGQSQVGSTPVGVSPFASGGPSNQFAGGGPINQFAGGLIGNPMAQGGANPYLDATFDLAARRTRNQLTSEFARVGRNVGAAEPARADQLNDLATQIYGGAYESDANRRLTATEANLGRQYGATEANLGRQFAGTEANLGRQYGATESGLARQFAGADADAARRLAASESMLGRQFGAYESERARQQQLVPMAGQLASQDYADIGQLANVGAQYEGLARERAGQPGLALDEYLARLAGYPGSSVASTIPMERNRLAGALGGAQLGGMMTDNPWGMIGGALGGLFL